MDMWQKFRSHPPFIPYNGHPIVSFQVIDHRKKKSKETSGNVNNKKNNIICSSDTLDLLVVEADGYLGKFEQQ
jgi:hypothetical protein